MRNTENALKVQCFVKKNFTSIFDTASQPKLLYVSKIEPAASAHPRVMHAHKDFIEIILICSGISEYLIHDKKQYIRQGDVIIYNSKVVHDEISGPDIAVGSYCVAIGGLHLPGLRENALIADNISPIFRTNGTFEDIRVLCEMMYHTLADGQTDAEGVCHYLMLALLTYVHILIRGAPDSAISADAEPHILGRRIKEYIDQHYMEPITLQSLGDALHMSSYYASHVFKQMSGYSPMQYLLRRRIGEAQTLLITTDYPLSRISEIVGYDTQSYFNLQFTKNVGMSPKKYRQSYVVTTDETTLKPAGTRRTKKAK